MFWVHRLMQTCSVGMSVPAPACPYSCFWSCFQLPDLRQEIIHEIHPSYSIPVSVNLTTATALSRYFEETEVRPQFSKLSWNTISHRASTSSASIGGVLEDTWRFEAVMKVCYLSQNLGKTRGVILFSARNFVLYKKGEVPVK